MHAVFLATVTLGALVLRLPLLAPSTLFQDDAWAALVSRADGPAETLIVGPTTPGFSLALWGVLSLVGLSSLAAQALPFLAGVFTPALTYVVGLSRRLQPVAAGTAAAFIAVSPTHIAYSGRVKQFTVDALLVIVLVYVGGLVCDRPESRRRWAMLTVASLAAIGISVITAVGVVGAYAASTFVALRRRTTTTLTHLVVSGLLVGGISGAWWLLFLDSRVSPKLAHYWRHRMIGSADDPRSFVTDTWDHFVYLSEWFTTIPAPVLALLLLAGLACLLRRGTNTAILFVTPVLALGVLAVLHLAPLGGGRTDIVIYPAVALLAGAAISPVARWSRPSGAVLAVVIVGALLVWPGTEPTGEPRRPADGRAPGVLVAGSWPYPEPYPLRDLRPLIHELEQRRRPDDAVFLGSMTLYPFALYTGQSIGISSGNSLPGIRVTFDEYSPGRLWRGTNELRKITNSVDRVWVLVGPLRYPMSPEQVERLQELGFEQSNATVRNDARLSLWKRPANGGDGS